MMKRSLLNCSGTTNKLKGKLKVGSNIKAPYEKRFFHNLWAYQVGQFTSGNVKQMKDSPIGAGGGKNEMVFSDIQCHALHRFNGDKDYSLVIAIPKTSKHFVNVHDCEKASHMVGHTDPQLFHWFKQLGVTPPRSLVSGKATLLNAEETFNIWDETFVRHPHMHTLAQKMWENDESKTQEERDHIAKRIREEDDKRMRRMTNPDWRQKQKDREQNPTQQDDEEQPIYVMKSDSFALVKLQRDVQLWGSYMGAMKRVWEPTIPPMDPLARASMRFIQTSNLSRQKLVSAVNLNYNMKLLNMFVYAVDSRGMWAMGTQENFAGEQGEAKENWSELRVDFGEDQEITDEGEMEWWFKGLMRIASSETGTMDADMEEKGETLEFRHAGANGGQ